MYYQKSNLRNILACKAYTSKSLVSKAQKDEKALRVPEQVFQSGQRRRGVDVC
jgi:hypothetical protein